MSAVLIRGQELRNAQDIQALHFKMREIVVRRGAGAGTVRLVDQIGLYLFEEDAQIRNLDEASMSLVERNGLLDSLAIDLLKGNLKASEEMQLSHREHLPWLVFTVLELIGWIINYPRFSAFKEFKRIVEGL